MQGTGKKMLDGETTIQPEQNVLRRHKKSSTSKCVIPNPPSANDLPTTDLLLLRPQVYTISGVDLTKVIMQEKQYANMTPMERFLRDGGGSLQRRMNKPVPKGLL